MSELKLMSNNDYILSDSLKPMTEENIILYRYYVRGHGNSEGKRSYVKFVF